MTKYGRLVDFLKVQTLVACEKGIDKQRRPKSEEAVWWRSSLCAILTRILLISAMMTTILFEKKKSKVFEILEHLPSWKSEKKQMVLVWQAHESGTYHKCVVIVRLPTC